MMFREKYSALPEELFQTPQAAQIGQKMLDDRLGVITEYDEYMESSFIGMMGAEDETGEEICTGMMM